MKRGAMISACDYYDRIVIPTVDAFSSNNQDLRLALLACMATLHVVDYVMHNREHNAKMANSNVKKFSAAANDQSFAFCVVRGFALASKHCRLTEKTLDGFHSGNHMIAYPSFAGVARAGATFLGDKVGGITIHWKGNQYVNLTNALKETLRFLEEKFTELRPKSA